MSQCILVLGKSGSGKSTSIRNLDEKETFIIGSIKKELPFKAAMKRYSVEKKNLFFTTDYNKLSVYLQKISDNAPSVKTVVIDDLQFLMGDEFMKRAKETGYGKFTEMAQKFYNLITFSKTLRDDLNIYMLSHTESDEFGNTKMKTLGKLLDDKITMEALFTIVLQAEVVDNKHFFLTQNNGKNTVKSPMGMFENEYIENDLKIINEVITTYYK